MRFSHQKRMRVLLCQHVTDRNPDLELVTPPKFPFPIGGDITRFYCIVFGCRCSQHWHDDTFV